VPPAFREGKPTETPMNSSNDTASEQMKLWNGSSGRAWVEAQELLDGMFEPIEDLMVEIASAASPARVLDVGCGTGSTTLALARLLGAQGRCVGVDISAPMLAVARARAERESVPASFVLASAQDHAFERASFDLIVSRFGVMFFDDPVRAFANLRHAARAGGALRAIAWRSPAENPFMTAAERAAAPFLPNLPARRPDGPGQFAFADERRVRSILKESGWAGIDMRPIDVICTFPAKALETYVTRLGPVGMILPEADDKTRMQVTEAVRAAFEPYVHGAEVHFTAACWMVAAQA
jgi:SAM-dependent methyltransferase